MGTLTLTETKINEALNYADDLKDKKTVTQINNSVELTEFINYTGLEMNIAFSKSNTFFGEEPASAKNTLINSKADKTYVDTELNKKSATTYVNTELDKKASLTFVNTELDKKAATTYVNTELDKKANKNNAILTGETKVDKISQGYQIPANAGISTQTLTNTFFKIGTIELEDSQTAHIRVYGTRGYAATSLASGWTDIVLRGSNSSDTLESFYYGVTEWQRTITGVYYTKTADDTFDLFVKYDGGFAGLESTCVTGGTWTSIVPVSTGSSDVPINSVEIISTQVITTGGMPRFRITDDGAISFFEDTGTTAKVHWDPILERMGFGTTTPTEKIHVVGGNVKADAFPTNSDARLKDNVIPTSYNSGDIVDGIEVVQYDWKDSGNHVRFGVTTQQVSAVAPEFVYTADDDIGTQSTDLSKYVPLLIKEIQSLRKRISQIEGK